jgi:hypothetical protein
MLILMETTETQNTKPKTSKMAIAALITPVILWMIYMFPLAYYPISYEKFNSHYPLTEKLLMFSFWAQVPASIFFSTLACFKIKKSKGKLKGKSLSKAGVVLSIFLFLLAMIISVLYFGLIIIS